MFLKISQNSQENTCTSAYMENKVWRTLRKVKSTMPQKVYSKIYPSGSCQDKFYGTAKMHKLSTNRGNDFPLHPIISNIGTATYRL